ncbi:MAG: NAD(P)/FAD-dependent oxidoreductase [Chloroflexi bacterium]|nr:NAD(P)/FAD-dependent oxidoreductase [Chloroflexota bacterium]
MTTKRIIVIGAGASGMMAAGRAAELGAEVLLLEKKEQPGKKILITGKTRCNLTNTKELEDFVVMFGSNGRFLYSAFACFFRDELLEFLKRYKVETKTERGGRIFPVSDDAGDVVKAFERYLTDNRVQLHTNVKVTGIAVEAGRVVGARTERETYPAQAVILAAGGASYPGTGSSGDGYRLAAALGHTIVKLRPALVPLVVKEIERARNMQGVSLRNVRLTAFQCAADEIDASLMPDYDWGRGITGRRPPPPVIESRMGEMMMTHFGIGGPVTLLMSLAIVDALERGPVSVAIDLKPVLSEEQLRERLQRDFDQYGKRGFHNLLKGLLPAKMVTPFVEMTGIPPDKPGHQISAEERERLLSLLKSLRFNIKCPLPMSSAIVTAGGVSLKEIEPQTMGSHMVKGLYFCGEVMDLDADTGGYNLQAAFSTGWVAGEAAARTVNS